MVRMVERRTGQALGLVLAVIASACGSRSMVLEVEEQPNVGSGGGGSTGGSALGTGGGSGAQPATGGGPATGGSGAVGSGAVGSGAVGSGAVGSGAVGGSTPVGKGGSSTGGSAPVGKGGAGATGGQPSGGSPGSGGAVGGSGGSAGKGGSSKACQGLCASPERVCFDSGVACRESCDALSRQYPRCDAELSRYLVCLMPEVARCSELSCELCVNQAATVCADALAAYTRCTEPATQCATALAYADNYCEYIASCPDGSLSFATCKPDPTGLSACICSADGAITSAFSLRVPLPDACQEAASLCGLP